MGALALCQMYLQGARGDEVVNEMDLYDVEAGVTQPFYDSQMDGLICTALGLTGEAGEFADHIKKAAFQGHPLNKADLLKELGDQLWYLSQGARMLDSSLAEIAQMNIAKLRLRYPNGRFEAERSLNR